MWKNIFRCGLRRGSPIFNRVQIFPRKTQPLYYSTFATDKDVKIDHQSFRTEGALTLNEVFEHLQKENAMDIVVINLSKEECYVDYFIVVTGFSERHLENMAELTNKLYKRRKKPRHPFSVIEGKEASDNWISLDIGNIIVHFMLPEARQEYQLEKLWLLGQKHDDLMQLKPDYDNIIEAMAAGNLNLMSMNQDIVDAIDDDSFWKRDAENENFATEDGIEFDEMFQDLKSTDEIQIPGKKKSSFENNDNHDPDSPFLV